MSESGSVPRPARVPEQGTALSHRSRRQSGYILVATSLGLLFLLGAAGLSIDIGRMYITKTEAQAYVDSAAIAAAMQLDGSSTGIAKAQAAVASDTAKWRFDTTPFTNVTTTFGTSPNGPFIAAPFDPTNYTYARVVATVDLPMYLIRVVAGPSSTIAAGAVAGRQPITTLPGGEFPFSPFTRKGFSGASPDDPDDPYGFKVGNQYTLRWGAPGDSTQCGTDDWASKNGHTLAENGKIRGYCCVAESAAEIREAIVGAATDPITIGEPVNMDNGAKDTEMTTIAERVKYDKDQTAGTYAEYLANAKGNGARVVVVPVNGGAPNYVALGFAGFFLLPPSQYTGLNGNESACAIYLGAWTEGVPRPPAGGSGASRVRLYQ